MNKLNMIKKYSGFVQLLLLLSINSTPFFNILRYKSIAENYSSDIFNKYMLYALNNLWVLALPVFILFLVMFLIRILNNKLSGQEAFVAVTTLIVSLLSVYYSNMYIEMEINNYPNYLYSHYGIQPSILNIVNKINLVSLFIFSLFFIYKFRMKSGYKISIVSGNNRHYVWWFLSVGLLLIMVVQSLQSFTKIKGFLSYSNSDHVSRFEHFSYLDVLKKHTTDKSFVILPPQSSDWPAISNVPIARYFLFPRTLISSLYNINEFSGSELFFVEFSEDSGFKQWPIFGENNTISFNFIDYVDFEELKAVGVYNNIKLYKIRIK